MNDYSINRVVKFSQTPLFQNGIECSHIIPKEELKISGLLEVSKITSSIQHVEILKDLRVTSISSISDIIINSPLNVSKIVGDMLTIDANVLLTGTISCTDIFLNPTSLIITKKVILEDDLVILGSHIKFCNANLKVNSISPCDKFETINISNITCKNYNLCFSSLGSGESIISSISGNGANFKTFKSKTLDISSNNEDINIEIRNDNINNELDQIKNSIERIKTVLISDFETINKNYNTNIEQIKNKINRSANNDLEKFKNEIKNNLDLVVIGIEEVKKDFSIELEKIKYPKIETIIFTSPINLAPFQWYEYTSNNISKSGKLFLIKIQIKIKLNVACKHLFFRVINGENVCSNYIHKILKYHELLNDPNDDFIVSHTLFLNEDLNDIIVQVSHDGEEELDMAPQIDLTINY